MTVGQHRFVEVGGIDLIAGSKKRVGPSERIRYGKLTLRNSRPTADQQKDKYTK